MENDEEAAKVLAAASKGEAYDKQLKLLLQRRKETRDASATAIAAAGDNEIITGRIADAQKPMDVQSVHSKMSLRYDFVNPDIVEDNHRPSYAIVVAAYNFRHLPHQSEKTKDTATRLFDSLMDASFNRFSRRGSKLLINPSLVEFQDAMNDLQQVCTEERGASFFLFISTHGARVSGGSNAGSYMLFCETRVTSEEELLLTSIHELELARMIHAVSCDSKLVALELCQMREPTEKSHGEAPSIFLQVESGLHQRVYEDIVRREVTYRESVISRRAEELPITAHDVKTNPKLLNIVVMESCNTKLESPVRSEEGVSNFLSRFNDAFRGGAIVSPENINQIPSYSSRNAFTAQKIITYVYKSVRSDASQVNISVKALYKKQAHTKFELAAEFEEISQTPQLVGTTPTINFPLGVIPDRARLAPTVPKWVCSSLNSIQMAWSYPPSKPAADLPVILGFELQIRGSGRAREAEGDSAWRTASALQVLSYEDVVRNRKTAPTKVAVHGLASDTSYRFRIRAVTAGGWGPFSEASLEVRTQSATQVINPFGMIKSIIDGGGRGTDVANVMTKYKQSGSLQRQGVEILAKMAIRAQSRHQSSSLPFLDPSRDTAILLAVRSAMIQFKKDPALQRQACMLFGRLAESNRLWRTAIASIRDPSLYELINEVCVCTRREDVETTSWCDFALRKLAYSRPISKTEAARRIQNLYRTRKAREYVRALASSVYRRLVDPSSGQHYFYNTRTGMASWAMPAFLA